MNKSQNNKKKGASKLPTWVIVVGVVVLVLLAWRLGILNLDAIFGSGIAGTGTTASTSDSGLAVLPGDDSGGGTASPSQGQSQTQTEPDPEPITDPEPEPDPEPEDFVEAISVFEDGWYYDAEHVVVYLHTYGHLPDNYITKDDARSLGWNGGSVEKYRAGAAIGGDYYGNYEKLLPTARGRSYTECDIDTDGQSSRGAKRVIFSSDGLYFYTEDHYETFVQLVVNDQGTVDWVPMN